MQVLKGVLGLTPPPIELMYGDPDGQAQEEVQKHAGNSKAERLNSTESEMTHADCLTPSQPQAPVLAKVHDTSAGQPHAESTSDAHADAVSIWNILAESDHVSVLDADGVMTSESDAANTLGPEAAAALADRYSTDTKQIPQEAAAQMIAESMAQGGSREDSRDDVSPGRSSEPATLGMQRMLSLVMQLKAAGEDEHRIKARQELQRAVEALEAGPQARSSDDPRISIEAPRMLMTGRKSFKIPAGKWHM